MDREASTVFDLVRRITLAAAVPAALLAAPAAPVLAVDDLSRPTTEQLLMADVVRQTNEERLLNGCDALTVDEELTVVSVRQAHYMAVTGDFGHIGWRGSTFRTRSRAEGYHDAAGENIAWGYPDAERVVDAWMASPGHRRNILNCDAVAFGAGVQRATDGTFYWTQVFGYR